MRVTLSEEDSPVEKPNPFVEKNKQGPQQKPVQDLAGPNKPPKVRPQKLPTGPGERSDEESIGRPVQLDKDQEKPRQSGERHHQEGRPRNEPSGV
jgi:hypothetical protein